MLTETLLQCQGTGSYITRGLGNLDSWNSSSHGAGRRMSRTKAHSNIAQEDFEKSMKGILCDTHPSVKDEAPMAYKDLSEVMQNQESLTEIVHHLLPLINVKGFESNVPKRYRKNQQQPSSESVPNEASGGDEKAHKKNKKSKKKRRKRK